MTSIYPISTSLSAIECRASRESIAVGVEYFFMGEGSRKFGQIAEGNHDFRYFGLGVLNTKPQLNQASGRYRPRMAVLT
ncbi:hypothetical protein [Fortiea contorta]|uniref:hypothetical protein n=1 Tax=Fortiea contorta TaxID=1892405 RepID=UPI003B75C8BE